MKRVILKLSGEVLAGDQAFGISEAFIRELSYVIKKLSEMDIQTAIVIGAGNFWRGRTSKTLSKTAADHMGMVATVINSIALVDSMKNIGMKAKLFSGVGVDGVAQRYHREEADRMLNEGYTVVLAAGTGSPFFSTDSGAALRACELDADCILLAKKVDGVYDKDPNRYPDAKKYSHITYDEAIRKKLGVMDTTALVLCSENNIPIHVFGLKEMENIIKVAGGESIGTIVQKE